jgi:hypothetical protein
LVFAALPSYITEIIARISVRIALTILSKGLRNMSTASVLATARRASAAAVDDARVAVFDYSSAAELFPTRRKGPRQPVGYKRFTRAAEAVRFAIEDLSPELLVGACLEVDEQRYDGDGIRRLYESDRFPLRRKPARA